MRFQRREGVVYVTRAAVADRLARPPTHQGEPGSIPGRVTGNLYAGIVPDDAPDRRDFSRISCLPWPSILTLLHTHLNLTHHLYARVFLSQQPVSITEESGHACLFAKQVSHTPAIGRSERAFAATTARKNKMAIGTADESSHKDNAISHFSPASVRNRKCRHSLNGQPKPPDQEIRRPRGAVVSGFESHVKHGHYFKLGHKLVCKPTPYKPSAITLGGLSPPWGRSWSVERRVWERTDVLYGHMRLPANKVLKTCANARRDGNTARLARRSDEALGVRVSVARIAPSLLNLGRAVIILRLRVQNVVSLESAPSESWGARYEDDEAKEMEIGEREPVESLRSMVGLHVSLSHGASFPLSLPTLLETSPGVMLTPKSYVGFEPRSFHTPDRRVALPTAPRKVDPLPVVSGCPRVCSGRTDLRRGQCYILLCIASFPYPRSAPAGERNNVEDRMQNGNRGARRDLQRSVVAAIRPSGLVSPSVTERIECLGLALQEFFDHRFHFSQRDSGCGEPSISGQRDFAATGLRADSLEIRALHGLNPLAHCQINQSLLPITISTLASHHGEPGSIPSRITGFSQEGIVPDDAVGRRVPVSPTPSFRRRSIFSSITLIASQDLAVKSRPNLAGEVLVSDLNSEDLRADEGACKCGSAPEKQGREKREMPEKTRRLAASSDTIPTCENLRVALGEINSVRIAGITCKPSPRLSTWLPAIRQTGNTIGRIRSVNVRHLSSKCCDDVCLIAGNEPWVNLGDYFERC
ncbi:hypothetical protein PR048_030285 [Dryococelus australis]|uniref:Uncharacterized protein n=1 Tax=Dryococelus australis TaxID=614101 RepID=A0ABQ9G8J8_9NEOP|nr:hypothetical protein PR048_030285 [Dryococelus australis]